MKKNVKLAWRLPYLNVSNISLIENNQIHKHTVMKQKMAINSQTVRAKEKTQSSHGGASQSQTSGTDSFCSELFTVCVGRFLKYIHVLS